MFFSSNDRERIERNGLFCGRQVHYLQFRDRALWDEILRRGIDLIHPVPVPQSVSVIALEIAIYMGFQRIYLLGCDHDWILHLNTSMHFYEENRHTLVQSGYNEWFGEDLESYCRDYINLWQQYKVFYRVARAKSIHIFNATAGGLLDVFPRVRYESLFAGDKTVPGDG
jgi:hypothetical protein